MNRLAINTVGDDLENSSAWCKSEKIGIEVTDFAFPLNLDGDQSERIERHIKAVEGISPVVLHGPFFELVVYSRDPEIVAVAKKRHTTALEVAIQIGASYYIAHTNYNAFIPDKRYRKIFIEKSKKFWTPLADKAARNNIIISMENLWEPNPELHAELIEFVDHPNFKATFDNGHGLIFSDKNSSEWIETLGSNLAHCHLHDNYGEYDDHNPVRDGKEDWESYFVSINKYSPDALLVMESDGFENNKKSISRVRELQRKNN